MLNTSFCDITSCPSCLAGSAFLGLSLLESFYLLLGAARRIPKGKPHTLGFFGLTFDFAVASSFDIAIIAHMTLEPTEALVPSWMHGGGRIAANSCSIYLGLSWPSSRRRVIQETPAMQIQISEFHSNRSCNARVDHHVFGIAATDIISIGSPAPIMMTVIIFAMAASTIALTITATAATTTTISREKFNQQSLCPMLPELEQASRQHGTASSSRILVGSWVCLCYSAKD